MTTPTPASMTPAEALAELLEGNRRFVSGETTHPHQDAVRREDLLGGQRPFALVLGCSDSRVAPEVLFDRGLGDLFVIRTAGHVVDEGALGSVAYGVAALGVPLVVVLGHESCGAIHAADEVLGGEVLPSPELAGVVDRVLPSLRYARAHSNLEADAVVDTHVRRTVDQLLATSPAVAEAVAAGGCAVVGMTYRLTDGAVSVLDDPRSA